MSVNINQTSLVPFFPHAERDPNEFWMTNVSYEEKKKKDGNGEPEGCETFAAFAAFANFVKRLSPPIAESLTGWKGLADIIRQLLTG